MGPPETRSVSQQTGFLRGRVPNRQHALKPRSAHNGSFQLLGDSCYRNSMGKIRDPKLFSQEFGIDARKLSKLRLLDPILNADTKLFIDPVLLQSSSHKLIKSAGLAEFGKYFGD